MRPIYSVDWVIGWRVAATTPTAGGAPPGCCAMASPPARNTSAKIRRAANLTLFSPFLYRYSSIHIQSHLGARYGGQDLCRRGRLDLRAVARRLLSGGPDAKARARIRQPQAHIDRDQRHLLFELQAGELGEVAGRDARRLRVRDEGLALLH